MAGTVVGKAYYGKVSESAFDLAACASKTVTVEYLQEPGSERAYVIEGSAIRAFAAAKLAATGSPEADNTLKSPAGPKALAFDARGNLWFSNAEGVFMYAMEDLAKSDAVYRVKLTGEGVMGRAIPGAGPLAFDDQGNLWIGFFAGNDLVKVSKPNLAVSDTIQPPEVALKGSVTVLLEGLAFDEAGGAWMPGKAEQVVKVGMDRLSASGDMLADVVLTSPQIGYADDIAFNPAPEALPLRD